MPSTLTHMPPLIAVHLVLALAALVLGPVAMLIRKGSRWHRATGYAWVTLMLGAALSAMAIRDYRLPNIAGYTPVHLLVVLTVGGIAMAMWHISRRNIRAHRRAILFAYNGVVIAALFSLLPTRRLGMLVWHDWLGWM
ncbi:DUF2306 domain-containing protein [uncultured Methylibium sp.]|uniref:DUF2306 domain-containing protein n=1 Tax=uncultured Methylibium sp. TaxID=381093 RepID=UPI0025E6D7F5|nr:DUF2306 domain-containing protein [uncultured Methylibium sp.]